MCVPKLTGSPGAGSLTGWAASAPESSSSGAGGPPGPQSQAGTGAGASPDGAEAGAREIHSRQEASADRNPGSPGSPASSAARPARDAQRARCSVVSGCPAGDSSE